jgi:hypothetical protein
MNVNINFNKKEITILEPVTIKELMDRFKDLKLDEFKIVSEIRPLNKFLDGMINTGRTPNSFPPNTYPKDQIFYTTSTNSKAEDC